LFLILTACISCKKEQPTNDVPVLTTFEIYMITNNSAVGGGDIISDKGYAVFVRGVVWGTHENPTIDDNKTVDGSGTGGYVSQLEGLEPETVYYVRAYAVNSKGIAYGNSVFFQTPTLESHLLTTAEVTGITHNSATCGGTIAFVGGKLVIERGVVWGTHENPTIEDYKTVDGAGAGSYVSQLEGLEPETVYYVRAYATKDFGLGTAYGNTLVFQTLTEQETGTFTDNRDGTVYQTIKIGQSDLDGR
jgi:hypothetical protein